MGGRWRLGRKFRLSVQLYSLEYAFFIIWYATWPCSEKKLNFDLLTPTTGSGGWVESVGRGSAGKIFATMVLCSWFSLIWYATWPCSGKVEVWPFDPNHRVRGWGGRVSRDLRAKYLLPCCCVLMRRHTWCFHYYMYVDRVTFSLLNVQYVRQLLLVCCLWSVTWRQWHLKHHCLSQNMI